MVVDKEYRKAIKEMTKLSKKIKKGKIPAPSIEGCEEFSTEKEFSVKDYFGNDIYKNDCNDKAAEPIQKKTYESYSCNDDVKDYRGLFGPEWKEVIPSSGKEGIPDEIGGMPAEVFSNAEDLIISDDYDNLNDMDEMYISILRYMCSLSEGYSYTKASSDTELAVNNCTRALVKEFINYCYLIQIGYLYCEPYPEGAYPESSKVTEAYNTLAFILEDDKSKHLVSLGLMNGLLAGYKSRVTEENYYLYVTMKESLTKGEVSGVSEGEYILITKMAEEYTSKMEKEHSEHVENTDDDYDDE